MRKYWWKEEPIRDYVQFRLVRLDDNDNVVEVLYESKEYEPTDQFGEFGNDHYDVMMDFNAKYDFCDYDNCPLLEFQARRKSTGDKWWFLSDPIDDYYNT